MGGQSGCERRIEVIVKMQKKIGGGGGGVRSGRGWGRGLEGWGLVERKGCLSQESKAMYNVHKGIVQH